MIQTLQLPLLADADIVVVGGGPSGFAAALAAARQGSKVLVLEQSTMFGGLGTAGLVPMFAPTSNGERMVYGGIFEEINLEMCRRMNVEPWQESWQAINPEILKRLLDEKAEEAGIRFVFGAKVCEAEVENGRIGAGAGRLLDGAQARDRLHVHRRDRRRAGSHRSPVRSSSSAMRTAAP